MKISIIGVGNLGYSIAVGILSQKKEIQCKSLYLSKRNTETLSHLEKLSAVKITSDNKRAVKYSNVVIVAVQPAQLKGVLEEIKEVFNPAKHTLISVATGREIEEIEGILGMDAPIIRCMPNTAISVGQSMTCMSANENGMVPRSQQFSRLFPSLLFMADSSTQAHMPKVCDIIENSVSSYDHNIPELNDIVETLTKMVQERNTLLEQSDEAVLPSSRSSVLKILGSSKQQRIEQLASTRQLLKLANSRGCLFAGQLKTR